MYRCGIGIFHPRQASSLTSNNEPSGWNIPIPHRYIWMIIIVLHHVVFCLIDCVVTMQKQWRDVMSPEFARRRMFKYCNAPHTYKCYSIDVRLVLYDSGVYFFLAILFEKLGFFYKMTPRHWIIVFRGPQKDVKPSASLGFHLILWPLGWNIPIPHLHIWKSHIFFYSGHTYFPFFPMGDFSVHTHGWRKATRAFTSQYKDNEGQWRDVILVPKM